ncbi:MAG: ABC transporter permease [Fimbriimonadaceae bacterium]|nr:ABC transporter permease [Fimbriimonadaceae bacterium]
MNGYLAILRKEIVHIRRDPTTLVFALMIPLIQLVLFGFAIDFDVRYIPTVVADFDRSRESREYLTSLRNTEYILIRYRVSTLDEVGDLLRSGKARLGIVIPPDFARRFGSTRPPQVKVLVDGSDSTVAIRGLQAFRRPTKALPAVDVRSSVLYNPDMKTARFMIPGLIGIILQMVTVSLTSFSLVREKEQGTLEQIMVTPIGRLGLMLGKLTPYAVLAMIEMAVVLLLGAIVFDVHVAGSIVQLIAMTVPFVLASLALGLLISTIAKNQAQALQMTMLTMMPSFILSGFTFPRETMPGPIYVLSGAFPVTYFIEILRGVIVRGAGFVELWPNVLALLVIMTLLIVLSTTRFRKSIG